MTHTDPTPPGTPQPDIPPPVTPEPDIDPGAVPDEIPPLQPDGGDNDSRPYDSRPRGGPGNSPDSLAFL